MKRHSVSPRPNWQGKVEELGFMYHSLEEIYWDESAYYEFSMQQVEVLEKATNDLYELCLKAVEHVMENNLYDKLCIPQEFVPLIERSWEEDEPSIYGRFDFSYDGIHPPKLLEFNADTPTSLYESSIVQWFWSQDFAQGVDQFNSIHEKLVAYWKMLKDYLKKGKVYFSCVKDNTEDYVTVQYLRDCAIQAGLDTEFIYIEEIGWNHQHEIFVDMSENGIKNIFKLYPYEWLIHEEFGQNLIKDRNAAFWIEPAWKMILSNKGILPILWELNPYHENLLPTFFTEERLFGKDVVIKPLLSREGANIRIKLHGEVAVETDGDYGEEGYIYQEFCALPKFDGNYAVIGSWLIGGESAGIGIRESKILVTDNTSRFVPHVIS